MKTKTIIQLILFIEHTLELMLEDAENLEHIFNYNRAFDLLTMVIADCLRRGENPWTLEIDGLTVFQQTIFHTVYTQIRPYVIPKPFIYFFN